MGRFNWDLFGLSCTERLRLLGGLGSLPLPGSLVEVKRVCVDWTLMADFLLILDWRTLQPVLLVQCSRAAQAEE